MEANIHRLSRITQADELLPLRAKLVSILFQAAIMGGMSAIIFTNFGWENGWAPAAGFLILVVNQVYVTFRLRGSMEQIEQEAELEEKIERYMELQELVESLAGNN